MVTVGSLAFSISADVSNFTDGVVASKKELRTLKDAFLAGQPPIEKYATAIAHLESLAQRFPNKAAELHRTIAKMREEMHNASPAAKMLGDVMGRMGIVMDPVSAAFNAFNLASGVARAGLEAFEKVVSKVGDSMERLDELAKKSKTLGIGASSLVGMRRAAADISGVDEGTFDKAFTKFGVNLGQTAMTGKGPAADALERLGLSANKLSAMGVDEALLAVADAMKQIENNDERLALSKGILGKGGEELATMLASGGDAIRALMEDQERLSQTGFLNLAEIEQANDVMGRLGSVIQSISDLLASDLAPLIGGVADDMTNGLSGTNEKASELRDTIRLIALTTAALIDEMEMLAKTAGNIAKPLADVLSKFPKIDMAKRLLGSLSGGVSSSITADGSRLNDMLKAQEEFANKKPAASSSAAEIVKKESEKELKDKATAAKKAEEFRVMEIEAELELRAASETIGKKRAADLLKSSNELQGRIDDVNFEIAQKGKKLTESLLTPAEQLGEDFKELKDARRMGGITDATFDKGLEDLRRKARDMSAPDTGVHTVSALRAGTVEALRASTGGAVSEKQLEQQKLQREEQEKASGLLVQIRDAMNVNKIVEAP